MTRGAVTIGQGEGFHRGAFGLGRGVSEGRASARERQR